MQKRQAALLDQDIGTIVLLCMQVAIIQLVLPDALCTQAEIARNAHLLPVYRSMSVEVASVSTCKLAPYVYHSLANTLNVFCSWWRRRSHTWEASGCL